MPTETRLLPDHPIASLDEYGSVTGGGHGAVAARHRTTESIIALIERSGLRGRGGAGFPTGRKWRTIAANAAPAPSVVVNGAEGEPGTFKDRLLLRSNPYAVLEGASIAAHAMRADEVVIALKASFTGELSRLRRAIEEAEAAGWFEGRSVRVVEGPGEYLFGEETALMEVIEGQPPFPRVVPPYRHGLAGDRVGHGLGIAPPTLVDNVETLANIPGILRHGADWFRSVGTVQSPGTILCTVTGDIARHGVAEFPMGITLREVLTDVGGDASHVAAVLMGVSNPPLGPDQLDLPLTYEDLAAAGSGLGSASFIVIGDDRSLRDVAAGVARFLSIESCGQCTPCKQDGAAIAQALAAGTDARPQLQTVARGARCALAGQTERVVGKLLDLADVRGDHSTGAPYEILPLVDVVSGRAKLDTSHLRKRADWSYEGDEPDSYQFPVQRYADAPVTIRSAHVTEPTPGSPSIDGATEGFVSEGGGSNPFEALHRSHDRLGATIDAIRSAAPPDRTPLFARLALELARHRDAVERFVYPLLEHVDPELGADVVWYPIHHDHHAARLIARLEDAGQPLAPRLVDEICADVHASIIEIDRRILPLIVQHLSSPQRLRVIAGDLAAALDVPGT